MTVPRRVSLLHSRGLLRPLPPVARSALGSVVTGFGGQLALLVSGIIATRVLGPEDRGYLALLALVPATLATVFLFGSNSAATYYIAKTPGHTKAIIQSLIPLASTQLFLCLLSQGIILWILLQHEPQEVRLAGLISIGVGPALVVREYGLCILQGLQRFRPYNLLRLLPAGAYSILLLAAISFGKRSLVAIASVWVLTNISSTLALAVVVWRTLRCSDSSSITFSRGEVIKFGIKGFLGSATPLETFRVDQFVVGLFLTPTALGIYVASLAFTNLPRFIAQSLGMVALPYIAARPTRSAAYRAMWRFFAMTIGSSVAIATVLAAGAGFLVPFVFGQAFDSAVRPTQILLLGAVLFSGRRILSECLRGLGYPAMGSKAEIVSWITLIPTLVLLVPRWQLQGVAFSLVIAAASGLAMVAMGALGIRRDFQPVSAAPG